MLNSLARDKQQTVKINIAFAVNTAHKHQREVRHNATRTFS
jgi:hypothetical protein